MCALVAAAPISVGVLVSSLPRVRVTVEMKDREHRQDVRVHREDVRR
jgi:hypothetical protein